MKLIFCLMGFLCLYTSGGTYAQGGATIKGQIRAANGEPLSGVTITAAKGRINSLSDKDGQYSISLQQVPDTLLFFHVGYQTGRHVIAFNTGGAVNVKLDPIVSELNEVVISSGYEQISRERATGSYVQIDNQLLNRRVSTNLLERLDGVTSGLLFNRTNVSDELISIRGRSTLLGSDAAMPLIVVDNFPYEGDINNINPNMVESVTVLKDAAAASIWGARSGNGVIVITTKKGSYRQPTQIDFNTNITVEAKPNIHYTRFFLPSATFIEAEKELFGLGFFNATLNNRTTFPFVSPVVELLASARAGSISAAEADRQIELLKHRDVRNDYLDNVYQQGIKQQYALSFKGGSATHSFSLSGGLDINRSNMIRNGYNRANLQFEQRFKPLKRLEIATTLLYTSSKQENPNDFGFRSVNNNMGNGYGMYPYARLRNDDGTLFAFPKDSRGQYVDSMSRIGFMNGRYSPLNETLLAKNTTNIKDIMLKVFLQYDINRSLKAELVLQHQYQGLKRFALQHENSYQVRLLVNRYTQRSSSGIFTYPFPMGGILNLYEADRNTKSARLQFSYKSDFNNHSVRIIGGTEMRETIDEGFGRVSYGYNSDLGIAVPNLNFSTTFPANPSGNISLPTPPVSLNLTTQRFISGYLNASYSYKQKYSLTASARKDGVNLFGARANHRFTPLWSLGMAWNIFKEDWFKPGVIESINLRASYGVNGNVYNGSAYLTAQYSTNALNGIPAAIFTSAPNPELSWEKVRNVNIGLDFAFKNKRLRGSLDLYQKHGDGLVEDGPVAPSVGFTTIKGNAASTRTLGADLELFTQARVGKLNWQVNFLASVQFDKVLLFNRRFTAIQLGSSSGGLIAVEGRSLFGMYSYPSAGLDPANGDPLGYVAGKPSKDYTSILQRTNVDSLNYHGSARPGFFSSVRNTFQWARITVSFNITGKFAYYFRRTSVPINHANSIGVSNHMDFLKRWQKPGDELITTVPSMAYPANANRNNFYQYSSTLIEKGDHIRLQDIQMEYQLMKKGKNKWMQSSSLYLYLNNIGILWRKNKHGIDPDANEGHVFSIVPQPFTFSIGFKSTF